MGQKFVYVVNDADKVVSRNVTLGPQQESLRVIAQGLQPDDRVIIEGLTRVRPGQTVLPVLVKPKEK